MRKSWSDQEIKYLLDNYSNTSNKDLSIFLRRGIKSIIAKSHKLGLKKNESFVALDGKNWSEEEIEFLKLNFSEMRSQDIAEYLGRSVKSINKKSYVLNLKKSKEHKSRMISKRNKSVGRDINYELLKEISLRYKTRSEFQLFDHSAYQAARKLNVLDEICSHMIKQSFSIPQLILKSILSKIINSNFLYNTRKIIKPYELDIYFPEYKLAFEYDGKRWHNNDIIDKNEICTKNNIKLFILKENNRKYEKDIKNQLIDIIDEIGKITNKKITKEDIQAIEIDSDIFDQILDDNYIKSICNKYINFSQFRKENANLYNKLLKLKKLQKYTSHMKKNKISWNLEKVKEEIDKYEYLGDLIKNSHGCYLWVKRNNKEWLFEGLIVKNNKKLKYRSEHSNL